MNLLSTVLEIVGFALIVAGCALIAPEFGMIAAGCVLVGFGYLLSAPPRVR